MNKIAFFFFFFSFLNLSASKIFTSDISNFWIAFDSVATVNSSEQKIKFLNELYINKATICLKEYIEIRNLKAEDWLKSIEQYPKFWKSVRNRTISVLNHKKDLEDIFVLYKKIYPSFIEPEVYFTIGILKTGGTISINKIFIGTEMTLADSTVDSSELIPFFKNYFQHNKNFIQMVAHETTHIQQKLIPDSLRTVLNSCLIEGSCDFVSEIVLNRSFDLPHIIYGSEHKLELLKRFKKEYSNKDFSNWLYNYKNSNEEPADLGYYIGYLLSKVYYENSKNKENAIKELIEINWLNNKKLEEILQLTLKKYNL